MCQTSNGILYSKKENCFIDLSDKFYEHCESLCSLLPKLCDELCDEITDISIYDKSKLVNDSKISGVDDNFIDECISEGILSYVFDH